MPAPHNVIVEKGEENVRRGFLNRVVRMADEKQARVTAQKAKETWQRILQSFASHPDGVQLADGLVTVVQYFSQLGFWRGYRNAKRHYIAMNAVKRTPDGRQEVHREIEKMLEENIEMPADKICERLDQLGLSASFDLKIRGKQKTILVGPGRQFCWKSVRKEDSLKNMVSRLRKRVRRERNAMAWMKLVDRAFTSDQPLRQGSGSDYEQKA